MDLVAIKSCEVSFTCGTPADKMCLELAQDFCIGLEYFKQNLPSRLNPTLELLVNITQETPLSP